MTTSNALQAWHADTAVVAAALSPAVSTAQRVKTALSQFQNLSERSTLTPEQLKAFEARAAAEQALVEGLAPRWNDFLARRLVEFDYKNLNANEVNAALVRHRAKEDASNAIAPLIEKVMENLKQTERSQSEIGPEVEGLFDQVRAVQSAVNAQGKHLGMTDSAIEEFVGLPWPTEWDAAGPSDEARAVFRECHACVKELQREVLVPALFDLLKKHEELYGFMTFDFPLFLEGAVRTGDERLAAWIGEGKGVAFEICLRTIEAAAALDVPVVAPPTQSPRARMR